VIHGAYVSDGQFVSWRVQQHRKPEEHRTVPTGCTTQYRCVLQCAVQGELCNWLAAHVEQIQTLGVKNNLACHLKQSREVLNPRHENLLTTEVGSQQAMTQVELNGNSNVTNLCSCQTERKNNVRTYPVVTLTVTTRVCIVTSGFCSKRHK